MATTKKKPSAKAKPKVIASTKKSVSNRTLALVAALAVIVVSVVGFMMYNNQQSKTAGAAGAATCGSGYSLVASKYTQGNYGRTLLYRNTSAQKYCALFTASGTYGQYRSMYIDIYLTQKGGANACNVLTVTGGKDSGKYRYYAGPVYVSYAGKQYCSVYAPGGYGEQVGSYRPYASAFITYKP